MQKLGIDLRKYQKALLDRKLSQIFTLNIAIQVLRVLKSVHSYGIVHNDIKPFNIMTDRSDSNIIYLIDFGADTTYIRENKHILYKRINKGGGTLKYNSINCLMRRSLSRRDGFELLAYVLVQLRSGKLPWDEMLRNKEMSLKEKVRKLIEWRRKPAQEICDGMCKEFVVFLNEVRSLRFEQKPDYDKYCKMFGKLLK